MTVNKNQVTIYLTDDDQKDLDYLASKKYDGNKSKAIRESIKLNLKTL